MSGTPIDITIVSPDLSPDRAAKEAAMRTAEFVLIPYRDWFPLIKETTYYLCNETWKSEGRELGIMEKPGKWKLKMMQNL